MSFAAPRYSSSPGSSEEVEYQYNMEGENGSAKTVPPGGARKNKEASSKRAAAAPSSAAFSGSSNSRSNQHNPRHSRDKRDETVWAAEDEDIDAMELLTTLSEDGGPEETLAGAGGIGDAIGRGRRREERMFLEVRLCSDTRCSCC